MNSLLDEIIRQQRKNTEKTIVDMITRYDFIVGSIECVYKLQEILPKNCEVICTPYIDDPSMIYAIKRYDLNDLLHEYNDN